MLSNLHERLPVGVTEGPPKPAASGKRYTIAFVQQHGSCSKHGPYPLNMQLNGVEYRHLEGCPVCREQARAAELLAGCNIPPRFADATFENWIADTDAKRSVLTQCRDYADNFRQRRQVGCSLILCGEIGTGKNHLATAICKQLLANRFTVLRVKAAQFLDEFWAKGFAERDVWLQRMARVDLLMVDEIGRTSQAKAAQDAFFRLIDARYESMLPTLVTTNLDKGGLIEVLGEAAYDRLRQGGTPRLTLAWGSHRAIAGLGDQE